MALKVLLVEDDPVNVQFIKVVLTRKGGYEVVVSEDVQEILALARSGTIALILMDISLTHSEYEGRRVDGIFITRLLKHDPATAQIPIVLATAHAMFGDQERYLQESGAEHYISKPIHDPDHFLREIRKALPSP